MGKGGNNTLTKKNSKLPPIAALKKNELPSKKDMRNAIPAHCFQHNTLIALGLVVRDAVVIGTIGYLGWQLPISGLTPLHWALWSLYWFAEGAALTGWWVLAHECGHRGFSENTLVCDIVGWVLHSFLLVPYFSWQYSHAKHHAKTNNLVDGETHVPGDRKYADSVLGFYKTVGGDAFALWELLAHLIFGWPMYLLFNATGARRTPQGEPFSGVPDHFRPWSQLFPSHGKWAFRVFLSSLGCVLTLAGLYYAGTMFGFTKVFMMYFPSYMWANCWLVLYTWLQHTDINMPHFGEDTWTWERGALATIDRPYGIFDWMHHGIGSTHVVHHVFSNLPCYHAVEATKALKAYLEPKGLYAYDDTPILVAAWKVSKMCHYVEGVDGVQFYHSLSELANQKKSK